MRKTRKRNIRRKTSLINKIKYFLKIKKKRGRKRKSNKIKKILLISLFIILSISIFPFLIGFIWLKKNILTKLPPIEKIEDLQLAQTSIITDRNGKILYKLFEENREYVPLKKISKNMINAIVATEDKNFWQNPGVDFQGLLRAAIHDILNPKGEKQGGSTLTQQLIKNLLLSREKTIERKLKEIFLALKIHNYFEKKFKQQYKNLSKNDLEKKVKEKILELYLNYIFLGNNAYGVEAASKTYFRKNAKDLDILEAAILAGIPKAPSKYNPISNPKGTLGYFEITNRSGEKLKNIPEDLKNEIIKKATNKINKSTLTFVKNTEDFIAFLTKLLNFDIEYKGTTYNIKYIPGRKDIVLARMFEEKYINSEQIKKVLIEGFNKKIYKPKTEILAPHFVMFIIKQLEQKYGKETLIKGGLTIKTTLDYNIQKLAEESILENENKLKKYGANNAALIYVDSKNGDILAYVGSKNYWDKTIDGQVDIIQSLRQPGSSIKPLVYAYGFMKLNLTESSPIYDTPIKFGNYSPNNVDGKFLGLMAIKNALPYSRNIPAIKMLKSTSIPGFIKFLNSIGVKSIKNNPSRYGLSLAIGSAEVKMYEWAQAFMHLSALGKPAKLNPILEIKGKNGEILYKKNTQLEKQIIPSGVAYIIRDILSNKLNFPPDWRSLYTYPTINFATKSGTTNKKLKNGENIPMDGWFVAYTPSKVMVFWAGNTDSSPLKWNGFGANLNSPIWKTFTKKLENIGYIKNENIVPIEVKKTPINKINNKKPTVKTPLKLTISDYGYIKNLPRKEDDTEKIKIDILCNGLVSELTPPNQIKTAYIIHPEEYFYNKYSYDKVIERWKEKGISKFEKELNAKILLEKPKTTCIERQLIAKYGTIKLNIIKPKNKNTVGKNFEIEFEIKSPFKLDYIKFYMKNKTKKVLIASKKFESNIRNYRGKIYAKIPIILNKGAYILEGETKDDKGYIDIQKIIVFYK